MIPIASMPFIVRAQTTATNGPASVMSGSFGVPRRNISTWPGPPHHFCLEAYRGLFDSLIFLIFAHIRKYLETFFISSSKYKAAADEQVHCHCVPAARRKIRHESFHRLSTPSSVSSLTSACPMLRYGMLPSFPGLLFWNLVFASSMGSGAVE